jgi:spermidine/putrescine transport system ATP-binding protein
LVFLQNASDSEDIAHRDDDVWLSWRPEHSLALAGSPSDTASDLAEVAS